MNNKEFVVHIVDESYLDEMNQTSASYPEEVSEIDEAGLHLTKSNVVKVPGVKEAKIRMECRLKHNLEFGNESQINCDFLIGEVVMFHFHEDVIKDGKIDSTVLDPIARLAGSDYAKLGRNISISRPN